MLQISAAKSITFGMDSIKFRGSLLWNSVPHLIEKENHQPGADPEKNLTRAQPKARGCGYMGVALSMGSYRHDLVDAAQLSA